MSQHILTEIKTLIMQNNYAVGLKFSLIPVSVSVKGGKIEKIKQLDLQGS